MAAFQSVRGKTKEAGPAWLDMIARQGSRTCTYAWSLHQALCNVPDQDTHRQQQCVDQPGCMRMHGTEAHKK